MIAAKVEFARHLVAIGIDIGLFIVIVLFARRTLALRTRRNRAWVVASLLANGVTTAAAAIQILDYALWNKHPGEWITTIIATSIAAAIVLQSGVRARSAEVSQ